MPAWKRICPLVKLSREKFHAEYSPSLRYVKILSIQNIYRRFGKHNPASRLEDILRQVFHVIADQYSHIFHTGNIQVALYLLFQFPRLDRKRFLLFHINALHIFHDESIVLHFLTYRREGEYSAWNFSRDSLTSGQIPPYNASGF